MTLSCAELKLIMMSYDSFLPQVSHCSYHHSSIIFVRSKSRQSKKKHTLFFIKNFKTVSWFRLFSAKLFFFLFLNSLHWQSKSSSMSSTLNSECTRKKYMNSFFTFKFSFTWLCFISFFCNCHHIISCLKINWVNHCLVMNVWSSVITLSMYMFLDLSRTKHIFNFLSLRMILNLHTLSVFLYTMLNYSCHKNDHQKCDRIEHVLC